jgi:nitrogen fixation protein NifU and related proteins
MSEPLDDLYREIIMDHYHSPRGAKKLDDPDITNEGTNPSCGDEIEVELKVNDQTVGDVSVACKGCAISVASGSMLAEAIKGKSLEEVKRIAAMVKEMLKGHEVKLNDSLGDLEVLKNINKFPVRVKCALLSWTTLIDCLEALENDSPVKPSSTE